MVLNFEEIKYNIDLGEYLENTYYECSKYEASDSVYLFKILEHIKKIATREKFLDGSSFTNMTVCPRIINLNKYPAFDGNIMLEKFAINLNTFFDIVYDAIRDFEYDSYTKPLIVLIGTNLQAAITNGRLPDERTTFNYIGLPRVIYVPEMEGTAVLGEKDIE